MCADDFSFSPSSEEEELKKLEIIFISLVFEYETPSYDRKSRKKFKHYTSP